MAMATMQRAIGFISIAGDTAAAPSRGRRSRFTVRKQRGLRNVGLRGTLEDTARSALLTAPSFDSMQAITPRQSRYCDRGLQTTALVPQLGGFDRLLVAW